MFDISRFKDASSYVTAVCSPLFKYFSANYFRLLRIYKNGKRVMLCSNPEVLDMFYGDGLYQYAWLDGNNPKISKNLVIWQIEKISMNTTPEHEICRFLKDLSINEGYALIHDFGDFYECYDIAAPGLNIYEANLGLLQRFCFYFKQETMGLLDELAYHAINVPTNITHTESDFVEKNKFLNDTKISRFYFDSKHNYLTVREAECVRYKVSGFSSKEIGNMLNISNRTVEVHLENVRHKINFLKHAKLITEDMLK